MRNALLIVIHFYYVLFTCTCLVSLTTIHVTNFVVVIGGTSVSSSLLSLSSNSKSKARIKSFFNNQNNNINNNNNNNNNNNSKNSIQTTINNNKKKISWKSLFIKEKQQQKQYSTQEEELEQTSTSTSTSTSTNTACSFYIWNLPLAIITVWCNSILQKDCIYEGLGGKKFIRLRPGSIVQYLYPIVYGTSSTTKNKILSTRQQYKQQQLYQLLYGERDDYINNVTTTQRNKLIDNCIVCGNTYNDHKVKWSSNNQQQYHNSVYIFSPYDIYFNTIQQQQQRQLQQLLNTTGIDIHITSNNNNYKKNSQQQQQTNKNSYNDTIYEKRIQRKNNKDK